MAPGYEDDSGRPSTDKEECYLHYRKPAVAHCDVCKKPLCSSCLTIENGKKYCSIHKNPALRKGRGKGKALSGSAKAPAYSKREWKTAMLLGLVGGLVGAHRLYIGRYWSGLFQMALLAAFFGVGSGLKFFETHSMVNYFVVFFLAGGFLSAVLGVGIRFAAVGDGFGMRFVSGLGSLGGGMSRQRFSPLGMVRIFGVAMTWLSIILALIMAVLTIGAGQDGGIPRSFVVVVSGILCGGMLTADLLGLRINALSDGENKVLR